MPSNTLRISLLSAAALFSAATSHAVLYDGIEFPEGAISFADEVVSYDPSFGGGNVPTDPDYMDPSDALGIPDYSTPNGSVSLGAGGRIVLKFIDNFLTGSGNNAHDLHIFEIGSDVEDTDVDISKDGILWYSVGTVAGATSSIDIDQYGFTTSDQFKYVRLTDVFSEGGRTGSTVGADIDAVGAISTVYAPPVDTVPDSGSTLAILGLAFAGIVSLRRRFR